MRRALLVAMGLCLVLTFTIAQDFEVLLKTFQRNFERSEQLDVKIKILQDSAKAGADAMGPLYLQAVQYVVAHSERLIKEPMMKELAVVAVEQIRAIRYVPARKAVWRLFLEDPDTVLRVSALQTLGVIGQGDEEVVGSIVKWLESQNTLFLGSRKPDMQVIRQAVITLGELKSTRAFSVLFSVKELGYSETITKLAERALLELEGKLAENLIHVVRNGTLMEKLSAIRMASGSQTMEGEEKARVAEVALEVGIFTTAGDAESRQVTRDMRRVALSILSDQKWSKATPLVIEHFGMTLVEYERGIVANDYLIDAINGLGSMGTHEAAERLTLYLELLNSYTEHGRSYDERIVLTVLDNLWKLGDKVAFANLSYTQYLDYSNEVKKAARRAIDNLKW